MSFVRQLAAGELPGTPELSLIAAHGYYALPVKCGGEPRFELPALTPELPLELPLADFEGEADTEDADQISIGAGDPA